MDMLVGDYTDFQYFVNTGTATAPVFTAQTGTNNAFAGITSVLGGLNYYIVPTLGDIDGDGDLDLFVGADSDTILYFKNTGTASVAAWTQQTGTNNIIPDFPDMEAMDELAPRFVDIDNDGDLDVFIGEEDHTDVYYLRNTGTSTAPVLVFENGTSTNNPFAAVNPLMTGRTEPGFGDIDADGDMDALIGQGSPTPLFFENTGTASVPNFQQMTGTNNPFDAILAVGYFYPSFVDIDGDTDFDMFVGADDSIRYYKNVNPNTSITESTFGKEFSMYPNPANNQINVNINGKYAIRITDLAGHVVMQQTLNEKMIDVSMLTSGAYTVEVTQEGNKAVRSLVISK
jgi:hypothetical protein